MRGLFIQIVFDDDELGRNYPECRCCGLFLVLVVLISVKAWF